MNGGDSKISWAKVDANVSIAAVIGECLLAQEGQTEKWRRELENLLTT